MATKVRKTTRRSKGKVLKAVEGDKMVVAVDVHKKTYHVAVRKNNALASTWVMPHDDAAVAKMLEPARPALQKVLYEAGPTGYGLARTLQQAGFPVGVVAPGKTPQPVNEDNKSDRLDCRKLAEFEEKGLLKYVAVPTEDEDAERSVMRRRDTLRQEAARAKTRIKSFLLYHGIEEPEGLKDWSKAAVDVLRKMPLDEDVRFTLDSLLRALDFAKEEMARVNKRLAVIEKRHAEDAAILRSHPGVGDQTVRHVLTELFDPQRFSHKRQVVAYAGLAPKVSRSGEGCRTGGRLRAGRKALRDCLIEASWQWIRRDSSARAIYGRILRNTGEAKKAITALARRMLVNLWTMLMRRETYRPPRSAAVGAAPTSA